MLPSDGVDAAERLAVKNETDDASDGDRGTDGARTGAKSGDDGEPEPPAADCAGAADARGVPATDEAEDDATDGGVADLARRECECDG